MIIVTGTILATPATIDEVIELSLAHVRRSRAEAGCLVHTVQRDLENPLRLVFYEEWRDIEALKLHFSVPASGGFVGAVRSLAAAPPTIQIYAATPIQIDQASSGA